MSSSFPSSRRDGSTAPPPPPPAPGPVPAAEARDWAGLARDIILDIFLRLGPREVMLGAEFVCKPWRSVALEEPMLWRRVGTENPAVEKHWRYRDINVQKAMNLVAVDRAAGQCEAFHGVFDCDDEYLLELVERAPSLKCLHIYDHYSECQSGENLVLALTKLPLLEELEIYFRYMIKERDENMLHSVCQACPSLKKLVLMFVTSYDLGWHEDEYSKKERIDGKIPMMLKLHTLELCDCDLKVVGLKGILDSCPVLETLDIDGYFKKRVIDEELRAKCARVKNLSLPTRKRSDDDICCCCDDDTEEEYYSSDGDSMDDYSEGKDEDSLEE